MLTTENIIYWCAIRTSSVNGRTAIVKSFERRQLEGTATTAGWLRGPVVDQVPIGVLVRRLHLMSLQFRVGSWPG